MKKKHFLIPNIPNIPIKCLSCKIVNSSPKNETKIIKYLDYLKKH